MLIRGYGGYNTRWALFLLHHLFPVVRSMSFLGFSFLSILFCGILRFVGIDIGRTPQNLPLLSQYSLGLMMQL